MAAGEEKHLAERQATLLQQAAAAAEAQEGREGPGIQLLLFSLGGESYAFPLERVREVVKPGPTTPVPSIPKHILGVMNLRGEILPVLDLKRLLGVGEGTPTPQGRIIVVKTPGMTVGFLADGVEDAIEVRESMEPPLAILPERQAQYLQGQVTHERVLVGVLDVEALLGRRG
jgi:purine-binding chemotaxis protein CheW